MTTCRPAATWFLKYKILTGDKADVAFEEYIDSYIDDVITPEVPSHLQRYIDQEAIANDMRMGGRGSSLATYDGHEHEVTVFDTTYYIYRTNYDERSYCLIAILWGVFILE